jgi:hypothetical protein
MKIVTRIAHGNMGMKFNFIPGARILKIVTRKFTELIVIETVMSISAAAPKVNPT